jgi:hypothetical protein
MKLRSVAALADREATSMGALRAVLDDVIKQKLALPEGCSVTYELAAVEIFEELLKRSRTETAIEAFYGEFLERHGVRPTATEVFHQGINPRSNSERSWLGFVSRMGGLSSTETNAFSSSRAFLDAIEKTEISRSYKIVLLLALLSADAVPGEIGLDQLVEHVAAFANRYHRVRDDFSIDTSDSEKLRRLLVEHPIRAFVEGKGTDEVSFFRFEGDRFSTSFQVEELDDFRELLREILDWRLAQYLSRPTSTNLSADIVCRVARAGDRPILFLPSSAMSLGLELGPVAIEIDGLNYEAVIAKIAINVVRRTGQEQNLLPEILRRWFGGDAGLPGRGERVRLKRGTSGFTMEPLKASASQGLQLWGRYLRGAIAPAFNLTFSPAIWNAGFVAQDPEVFLLVTLAKEDMSMDHRYVDRFVSDREFAWQSQNRTTQSSKHGQLLYNHQAGGQRIHLFVRPAKKTGSNPTPFTYCGQVDFLSWEGDAPISIRWQLREPVPPTLHSILSVPS